MPVTSETIGLNWGLTTQIIAHGENLLIFSDALYEVTPNGESEKKADYSTGTIAAAILNDFLYAVDKSGTFSKIRLKDWFIEPLEEFFTEAKKIKALVAHKDYLIVFSDKIWEVYPDGRSCEMDNEDWSTTKSVAILDNYAYVLKTSGEIFKLNLDDYTHKRLSYDFGVANTLVAYKDYIYVFGDNLYEMNPANGKHWIGQEDDWSNTLAAVSTSTNFYAIHSGSDGNLWKLDVVE
ncbi:2098_t:CDS:1 [Ambispora gerdemannii]|uniref:2098_t:CDS:1 n=1 Tax=Ambispora gerdemannii TaxID=144530 RepID=A0A9N9FD33_9GLOM|nr:2098_t:CDS:1 [Ambispora gerdemannii]